MSTNSERITAHNLLIDQAQALVDALPEAGGGGVGLLEGISALASGTFTPTTSNAGGIEITHGLGVTPNFYIVIALTSIYNKYGPIICEIATCKPLNSTAVGSVVWLRNVVGSTGLDAMDKDITTTDVNTYFNENTFTAHGGTNETQGSFKTGFTYRWICGVMDGIE